MTTMKRKLRSDRVFEIINFIFLFFILIIVLYPLVYVISASISDPVYVNQGTMWLYPRGITFEGYQRVFQNPEIWSGYRNTILYTVAGTAINLLFTVPGAYALSRKDLKGRGIMMGLIVFTMFFGGGLIPSFLLVSWLGMLNTVWALLIPNAVAVYNLIICRTFFQTNIPKELQESAEIDGCSNTVLFLKIVLPLSAPIIAVMALYYGVTHWNSYFSAIIYLKDRSLYPLQLILREILVQNQMNDTMLMTGDDMEAMAKQARIADIIKYAVMIVSSLPIIVIYPFMQRFFMKGVLIGSVKG
ncbi:carbohydrate ABC transporter permease [Paenibacillus sp. FSL W8-0187]|uniref:Sugar ABC transporter permease n=1 Tax=Paenibacillus lautus TaxID=1401 RepID=A0A1R1B9P8_PAELA|nr:carbohydrate ABC transporter permease [Paenibacillus lautus]MBT2763052.1 carbohydrate ABC transporter permease [Paenibacillus sp. ISL-20]OME96742.1 sugar ABC transporter permease [Paenibacillus lautus]